MPRHVHFVEYQQQREPRLVEDPASVQHVAHERDRADRSGGVDHISDHGWKSGGEGFRHYGSGRGPREDLDLSGRVHDDVVELVGALFNQGDHLKRSKCVGSKFVLNRALSPSFRLGAIYLVVNRTK
jgi:hypothetical protein